MSPKHARGHTAPPQPPARQSAFCPKPGLERSRADGRTPRPGCCPTLPVPRVLPFCAMFVPGIPAGRQARVVTQLSPRHGEQLPGAVRLESDTWGLSRKPQEAWSPGAKRQLARGPH